MERHLSAQYTHAFLGTDPCMQGFASQQERISPHPRRAQLPRARARKAKQASA